MMGSLKIRKAHRLGEQERGHKDFKWGITSLKQTEKELKIMLLHV